MIDQTSSNDLNAKLSDLLLAARLPGSAGTSLLELRSLARSPKAPAAVFDALAQVSFAHGLIDEAAAATEQAIARDPTLAEAWHRLGIIQMQRGNPQGARQSLERAVTLQPDLARAQNNLGYVLQNLAFYETAAAHYRQAVTVDPGYAEAHSNLASVLAVTGRYDEALTHAGRAAELAPQYASPYLLAALIEAERERFDEALAWIARLPRDAMRDAVVLTAYAEILVKATRFDQALAVCRDALGYQPNNPDAFLCRGTAFAALGRREEALAAFDRAATLAPQSATPLAWKASVLMELARTDEAIALYDRARALEPYLANVVYMRAAALDFRLPETEIAALETMLTEERAASTADRTQLHFVLANAYLRSGENAKVFPHLREANRLKRSTINYDADTMERYLEAIAAAFPARETSGAGSDAAAPIFIVGMPRSGTTLVEQILASHPKVHGGGELRAMSAVAKEWAEKKGKIYPFFAEDMTPDEFHAFGLDYVARVGTPPDGKERTVDKMPSNALFAGLIHRALPNARIVFCQRNPLDTCFSCYTTQFTGQQNFAYDLGEPGRYHRAQDALMAHWRQTIPDANFLEVRYEDVVDDLEGTAKRLVAFCGLEWSADCLRFHESTRPVRTASMLQVRKPLYRNSIDRWRPFRSELGPLFAGLGLPRPD